MNLTLTLSYCADPELGFQSFIGATAPLTQSPTQQEWNDPPTGPQLLRIGCGIDAERMVSCMIIDVRVDLLIPIA